jgi:hypothetical protein
MQNIHVQAEREKTRRKREKRESKANQKRDVGE